MKYININGSTKKVTDEEYAILTEQNKTYIEKRLEEYPNIGDQLDAIMKWAFTEREIGLPAELKSIAGKCMAVKSKFPKDE